ncbi:hypothetical protein GCM10009814_31320 [Lapillicoccus jejuensis]|uniref:Uncharacterized protein n=2 Tax=Lapillicoccus jejuensis TaxID=402171 RepID=A0A542E290_9MICO|nr:hypothetical protein FB458_2454 [Lapillicoccus jejuensis]
MDRGPLTPAQQELVRRAERRSVIVTGTIFAVLMVGTLVAHYGIPGRWTTPDGSTPWYAVLLTLVTTAGLMAVLVPLTRSRLGSPGPRRDLVASGDLRDIVGTARDLGVGRRLDDRRRPVGRALVALTGRWTALCAGTLVLTIALAVLEEILPPRTRITAVVVVGVLGLLVLGSLGVLVWSALARRHGSAQGLGPTGRPLRTS